MVTEYHRLTLKKIYTNNDTGKCGECGVQVNQQQQCKREGDVQVSERTNNNVYTIRKQQCVHNTETTMCTQYTNKY